MKKKLILTLSFILIATMALTGCGEKEDFPSGNVTIVIPYGAGGTTDLAGRALASALSETLGVSVVVENKAGASGAVGTEAVHNADADGYTLLLSADSLGTQRVMGLSELSYDDFEIISPVTNDPKVIVVSADSSYETIDDLIRAMQENPDKILMSYTGPGGSGHVQSLIYNQLGLTMCLVAYDSGAACIAPVIAGQVDFTNSNYSTVRSYVEGGKLRILAISEGNTIEGVDAPLLVDSFPGYETLYSVAFTPLTLLAPKGISSDVLTKLRVATDEALHSEAFTAYVKENSLTALYDQVTENMDFETYWRAYYKHWESYVSWLLYDAGAAPNSPETFGIERVSGETK